MKKHLNNFVAASAAAVLAVAMTPCFSSLALASESNADAGEELNIAALDENDNGEEDTSDLDDLDEILKTTVSLVIDGGDDRVYEAGKGALILKASALKKKSQSFDVRAVGNYCPVSIKMVKKDSKGKVLLKLGKKDHSKNVYRQHARLIVKKGTKKGTYSLKVKAYHKNGSTGVRTIKIKVK